MVYNGSDFAHPPRSLLRHHLPPVWRDRATITDVNLTPSEAF